MSELKESREAFILISADGKRAARVLEFRNGATYLDEQELSDNGRFENRHSGSLVGPFKSPDAAENFIVATDWFCGPDAARAEMQSGVPHAPKT